MRDAKLEETIERVEALADRWRRFQTIYKKALKGGGVRGEEAADFAAIRAYLAERYPAVMAEMGTPVDKDDPTLEWLVEVETVAALLALPDFRRRKFDEQMAETGARLAAELENLERGRKDLAAISPVEHYARWFLARPQLVAAAAGAILLLLLWATGLMGSLLGFIRSLI